MSMIRRVLDLKREPVKVQKAQSAA
jgi:hypothetical protein